MSNIGSITFKKLIKRWMESFRGNFLSFRVINKPPDSNVLTKKKILTRTKTTSLPKSINFGIKEHSKIIINK